MHGPSSVTHLLPPGLVVPGMVYHGVGEIMIIPPPSSPTYGPPPPPPLSDPPPGGGLLGGRGGVDHEYGAGASGMGWANFWIAASKLPSFIRLLAGGEGRFPGFLEVHIFLDGLQVWEGSPPPPLSHCWVI